MGQLAIGRGLNLIQKWSPGPRVSCQWLASAFRIDSV